MKQGYLRARIDGEIVELTKGHKVDRYKVHDIELVVDRLAMAAANNSKKAATDTDLARLRQTVSTALKLGSVGMHHPKLMDKVQAKLHLSVDGVAARFCFV